MKVNRAYYRIARNNCRPFKFTRNCMVFPWVVCTLLAELVFSRKLLALTNTVFQKLLFFYSQTLILEDCVDCELSLIWSTIWHKSKIVQYLPKVWRISISLNLWPTCCGRSRMGCITFPNNFFFNLSPDVSVFWDPIF